MGVPRQIWRTWWVPWIALVIGCEEPPTAPPDTGAPPIEVPAEVVEAAPEELRSLFLGEDDSRMRESLATEDLLDIERGRGGRSLAFKITLANGTRGYFKPEQTFSAARWYSEVAAYYLDRELGLGRAPPTVGRRLFWPPLRRAARDDARVDEVIVSDRAVRGAFIGWIDGGLPTLNLPQHWEREVRLNGRMAISPYQRPADYRGLLNETLDASETELGQLPPIEDALPAERIAELSDLIVFDYLISNVDRWGGGFTNVRTRGRNGPLIFLDNGAGFWIGHRLGLMDARLESLQRFRRSTVDALERFDAQRFRQRLSEDPLDPILTERQLDGLEIRRQAVLTHVRAMRARYGDRIWAVQESVQE
ncbi:MAG: hypothetical protein AAGE52_03925 [Myxococcota bacterium]